MTTRSAFLFVTWFSLLQGLSWSQEPWADKKLPVKSGLAFWLDAKAQPEAWKQHGTRSSPLMDGRAFDAWFDGSGHKQHFIQRTDSAQPIFRQIEDYSFVSFDGKDDFLSNTLSGRRFDEFTLIALVAPQSNGGGFRAFMGASAISQNDYQSGFNIDQSFFSTAMFQDVNVEGVGFGGAHDLLRDTYPFGEFRLIEAGVGPSNVRVTIDGKTPGEARSREKRPVSLEEIVIGARLYSNEAKPPFAQGFLHGEIAELLVYNRTLTPDESVQLRKYIHTKYQDINKLASRADDAKGHLVKTIENPPAVQMLVPGFEVRELPLELPNINNVLYRADGKLIALGYDGSIWLLKDTDGDGLEDNASPFWENRAQLQAPVGMDLTPEGYPHGRGVFVASKGKCSLIVDTNNDDVGDREIVLAEGWEKLNHGVDALGVAYDRKDGSIYFGLGTSNYTDAYLINSNGVAKYDLANERGTILRIAPDLKQREIVCTGIRFPVALRFNAQGELFCTDQEGATWLPNGNPFDELLHIQRGRHYGFPPRHPKHLPAVIDEPSTYDYGPQHQSTCGLNFNEPTANGKIFGPAWWRGDAIVTGYSRGKLYRTQLIRTNLGYVAQNQLIACMSKLAADACVSPTGDLVIATHSGGPDWGSGPAGKGKIFKVAFKNREAAQPVLAWPASAQEVHVAFDRPVDLTDVQGLLGKTHIEHSQSTSAGDRFESVRPGYAVVQMQMATRRFDLNVLGIQLTPDRRTLVMNTDKHVDLHQYALSFPWKSRGGSKPQDHLLDQMKDIDLQYSLNGVAAQLTAADGTSSWSGWLPHLDLQVAKQFTNASSSHETLWTQLGAKVDAASSLSLSTQFELSNMLRSAVQPGSQLPFKYSPETVTLVLTSNFPLQVAAEAAKVKPLPTADGKHAVELLIDAPTTKLIPAKITLSKIKPAIAPTLEVAWFTHEDDRRRPVPLRRLYVPWATQRERTDAGAQQLAKLHPELEGGSWGRGRQLFFGDKAQCSKCHRVGLQGGRIGPPLTNLIHRDYESVRRDITRPSFAINPDHLSYSVALNDGRVLSGVVMGTGEKLIVGDKDGKLTEINRADIDELVPSSISIMPEGLDKQLGPDGMRDLLTFLLTAPPSMPNDLPGAPEPRSRKEVEAILSGSEEIISALKPLNVVLVAGRKDHGPGEHDYPAWLKAWAQLFEGATSIKVTTAMDWPTPEQFSTADAIVFYQQGTWNAERANDIDAFLKRGGGVSYIHYAVDGGPNPVPFAERIGLAWQGGASRFRHGELDLVLESSHPITRNFRRVHFHDESYWNLKGDPSGITLLASGKEENAQQPLIWCREQGKGRVFVSIPGHYSWTFDDPLFRILLLRGIAWSVRESVDRFNDLATVGARFTE